MKIKKKDNKFKKSSYKGNPFSNYSIEIYIGEVRSGKTLTMVAETYEQIKNSSFDTHVYSNIKLNRKYFPNFTLIGYNDLIRYHEKRMAFKNCIFLIDELHIFADSRRFMKKGNQAFGYFVGQMGKRGNTLRGNTHFLKLIDYRIRLYLERITYIYKGLLEDGIWYPIKNNNRRLSLDENSRLCIQSKSIIRKLVNYNFEYLGDTITYVMAKKYFDLYDTEELVKIDDIEYDKANK